MRGIRLVFLMAVATNRLFLIDWPKTRSAPFPLTTVLWPAAIDWRYDDSMLSSPAFSSSPSHHVRQLDFEQDEGYVYVSDRHMSSSGDDFDNAKKERLPFSVSDTDIPALFGSGSGSPAVIRVANRQPRSALLNLTSNPSVHQSLSGLQRTDNDAAALERRLMRVLFRASPTVDTAMRARVPTRPYVSVHARSGDDVGEAGISRLQHVAQHHEQTAQRMLRCVRNLHWYLTRKTRRRLERRREIGKGNLTVGHDEMSVEQVDVFVAADSQKFKQAFMDAAAAAAVNVDGSNAKGRSDDEEQLLGQLPVHVYTDGGRVVHVDRPNQVGASGSSGELQLLGQDQQERQQLSEEALCKGFVDVFADLFGLANAHGMAYLHSGFPVSALALSTINRWKELEVTPPYAPDECTIVKRS